MGPGNQNLEGIALKLTRVDVKIKNIRTFGEARFMKVKYYIHSDRTHFDLNVRLIRELNSNHLIMNVKVRVKPENSKEYVRFFDIRRINFCDFLTEYNTNPVLKFMFKKTINISDVILCPVRVGNYSMLNTDMESNMSPGGIQNGTYKFFAEIVEESGEIAKLFALQVTSEMFVVEVESNNNEV
ncbi:uncharacterized protein LOC6502657 [Drosophila ananassae]|uniref:uncharacterized protein LOC6502657 n=1 Tax=Drosophila ananassae TaxID=7217 RepID=UPI0013A5CD3A|nr:uncharacterized protein LOC6502657 [Drosophila ananassae]